jgi:hypothetical protein
VIETPNGDEVMLANPVKNGLVVEAVQNCEGVTFLTVSLGGGEHWDMFQTYSKLPQVVEFEGRLFGKSCWNSDNGRAYYRSDATIAIGK